MTSMTKQHFKAIAWAIKGNTLDGNINGLQVIDKNSLIFDLTYLLTKYNENFDEKKFREAC